MNISSNFFRNSSWIKELTNLVFFVLIQSSTRRCDSGSGLNQLCTKKLGRKDLSVFMCYRKASCQYDFHQRAIWKLILRLTLPPIICYQYMCRLQCPLIHIAPAQVRVRHESHSAITPLAVVSKNGPERVGP